MAVAMVILYNFRLQEMAKSSILVWIQKINYDLGLFLEGSIQKLNRKIESHRKKQEGSSQPFCILCNICTSCDSGWYYSNF